MFSCDSYSFRSLEGSERDTKEQNEMPDCSTTLEKTSFGPTRTLELGCPFTVV